MAEDQTQIGGARRGRVTLAGIITAAVAGGLPPTARAAEVFSARFDSATGTANGSAISGVTGGTATIRDNGGGDAAVVLDAPTLGGGGFLRGTVPDPGAGFPQGATFTPAAPENSLAALYSVTNGQAGLNGGFDFFFRSAQDVTAGEQFRPLDAAAPATGGLRLTVASVGATTDFRVEVITQGVTGFTDNTGTKIVLSNNAFQMTAGNTYHLGVTFSTDAAGDVTAKTFGVQGTGPIDTSATTLAEGLLGQVTFNFDEADVTQGFRSTAYDFGLLRAGGGAKTQDFDDYRLYNAVPAEFAAIPEPTGVGLLGVAALAALARRRR